MGVDAMAIGVYMRKGLIFTIRTCCKSACNHPFVMGLVFFFFFLYRFLPSVFGFLVSASPVIVCTFVLLGTLLSFGQPNIPEIEAEVEGEGEKKTMEVHHETSSLKSGLVEGDLVFKKDESFSIETHVEMRGDIEEKEADENDSVFAGTHDDGLITNRTVKIKEERTQFDTQKDGIEGETKMHNHGFIEKREFSEEKPSIVCDDVVGGESSHGGLKVETDQDSMLWKEVEDSDESSDSSSDGAESSSPDASMADIIPMLDELHPLLDTEPSEPALITLDDSDAASEKSQESNSGSEEEFENHEKDDDDDDDDEEQLGEQDDGTKEVVKWTRDDEKNLMDLGNSELERNRRLESLIARRRARKNFRVIVAEKNLIDLDVSDPPFQIAPISTARHNPFDLHYDSNEAMGLPPIPDSAPSVMLARRNPFDLPYGPIEERPNLSGGSFEKLFVTGHDMYFRRHESFSSGPSYFGEFKHDRPYFVPEREASKGMDYPEFQREFSERNDSKLSSITETESLSSVVDQDNHKNLIEQEISQEGQRISLVDRAEQESQSSEELESVEIDQYKIDANLSRDEKKEAGEEHAHGRDSTLPDTESVASHTGSKATDFYMKSEVFEEKHTGSSSSSLSKVHEDIFHLNTEEGLRIKEPTIDDITDDSNNSLQTSVVDSGLSQRIKGVDESETKEPIYDGSPPAIEKTLPGMTIIEEALCYVDKGVLSSVPSIVSNMQVDILGEGPTPASEEKAILLADGQSSLHVGSFEKESSSGNGGLRVDSSQLCAVDENESRSREATMISKHDVRLVEQVLFDSSSSVLDTESAEEVPMSEKANLQYDQHPAPSLSLDPDINVGFPHFNVDEVDPKASIYSDELSSEDLTHSMLEKPPPLLEKSMVQLFSDGDHEESQGPSFVLGTSIEEAAVINNLNEHNKDILDLYPLISFPCTIPSKVSENELTTDQTVLEDDFHDGIQNDRKSFVLGHLDVSQEASETEVSGDESSEAAEGIKEIDEELLTELDAVGDFNVDELGANTDKIEEQWVVGVQDIMLGLHGLKSKATKNVQEEPPRLIEVVGSQKPLELGNGSADVEAGDGYPEVKENISESQASSTFDELHQKIEKFSILESIHDGPLSKETEVGNATIELPSQDSNPMKTDLELPVLEARSPKDIDSFIEQIHEGEVGDATLLKPVHKESTGTDLKLPVLEATSLENDGSAALMHSHEGEVWDATLLEPVHKESMETDLKLPVLEATSLENDGSALMQTHEGEVGDTTLLEPVHKESIETDLKLPVLEATCLENDGSALIQPHQGEVGDATLLEPICNESIETDLKLSVLEATSLENDGSALTQPHEGEVDELLVLELIHDESIPEKCKAGSTEFKLQNQDENLVDSNLEVPVIEERSLHSNDLASEQLRDGEVEKSIVLESIHEESISEEASPTGRNPNLVDFELELPMLEARSLDDIDSAFKFLSEGGDCEKPTFPESVDKKPRVLESLDSMEILAEDKMENLPKPIESEVEMSEVLMKALESTKESTSGFEESFTQETTSVGELNPGGEETYNGSSSNTTSVKKKKVGSSKSSSSSSSSDSD